MKIITLMENCGSENKALLYEHGLSFYVEQNGFRLLFDCGPDQAAVQNARRLGVSLNGLSAVILSHNHYDHAAGYRDLIESGIDCKKLYTGDGFFERKYARSGAFKYCDISSGIDRDFLRTHGIDHEICTELTEILPGIYLVSNFSRRNAFEKIPERFVRETADGFIPDTFSDEIMLAAETKKGLVVLAGCSHPGILNMLETVSERLNRSIYAVFGGTHLKEADEERIEQTLDGFERLGIKLIGLNHCSGQQAEEAAAARGSFQVCHLAVGNVLITE